MRVRALEKLQYYSLITEGGRTRKQSYVIPAGVVFELHKDSDFRGDVYAVNVIKDGKVVLDKKGDEKKHNVVSMDGQPIEGGVLIADASMVQVADAMPVGSEEDNANPGIPKPPKKFNSAAEVFAYAESVKEAEKRLGIQAPKPEILGVLLKVMI